MHLVGSIKRNASFTFTLWPLNPKQQQCIWSYIHIETPMLAPAWDNVFPTICEEWHITDTGILFY
jgi:hypothetical protein